MDTPTSKTIQQQSTVIVTAPKPRRSDDKLQPKALRQMKVFSILQMVIGAMCTLTGIVLSVQYSTFNTMERTGYGIWIGINFILIGSMAQTAVRINTRPRIILAMILNIISAIIWFPLLAVLTYIALRNTDMHHCTRRYYHYSTCKRMDAPLALEGILCVFAVVEMIIAVKSSVICWLGIRQQTEREILARQYKEMAANQQRMNERSQWSLDNVRQPIGFQRQYVSPMNFSVQHTAINTEYHIKR